MSLRACALVFLLGFAAAAHASGTGERTPAKPSPDTAANEPLFPTTGSAATPKVDAAKRASPARGMFEYPSGDAAPVCVNPPPR